MNFPRLVFLFSIMLGAIANCPSAISGDDSTTSHSGNNQIIIIKPNNTKKRLPSHGATFPATAIYLAVNPNNVSVIDFEGHSYLEITLYCENSVYTTIIATPHSPSAPVFLSEGTYEITATADNGMIYTGILNI